MSPGASSTVACGADSDETVSSRAQWPLRGGVVMIAGPDGCGKTTLAQELARTWLADAPVLLVHHRRGIGTLPGRRPRGPTTEPHRHAPYPVVVSLGKLLYLFVDFLHGWLATIRPFVRRGGWVILQRDWWDLLVDPRRYRLRPAPRLGRLLGRLLPEPDLTIVLDADPQVVHGRKAELPVEELARQRATWRAVRPPGRTCVHIDATRPAEEVLQLAADELARRIAEQGGSRHAPGWFAVRAGGAARWLLPRGPRHLVRAGLDVHQPVTGRARIARRMARSATSVGIARLLPKGAAPPSAVTELVGPFVPRGGTFALARANHPSRWVALIIAPDGSPVALAKMATDERGREALAREASNLTRLAAFLTYPLSAPRLLEQGDGTLVMEAVQWQVRPRPWLMPEDVAFALGAFFRAGSGRLGSTTEAGLAHGDVAPWNLLKTREGWALVDWEAASMERRPFHDITHFLAQASTLLGRPTPREIYSGIVERRGWVGAAVAAYARGARRPIGEAWPRLLAYLDEHQDDPERGPLLAKLRHGIEERGRTR